MNKNILIVLAVVTPLLLSACGKKSEDTSANSAASTTAETTNAPTSAEQQAKIDSLDKPVLDDAPASAPAH